MLSLLDQEAKISCHLLCNSSFFFKKQNNATAPSYSTVTPSLHFQNKVLNANYHAGLAKFELYTLRTSWSWLCSPTHRRVWSLWRSCWGTSPSCRWGCPPTILPPPAASHGSSRLCWMTARPRCSAWSWSELSPSPAHLHRSQTSPVREIHTHESYGVYQQKYLYVLYVQTFDLHILLFNLTLYEMFCAFLD